MRAWKRWAALLPAVTVVAVIWPVSWGGQLGYVTTHGISMEPGFHTGDLAIVHPQRNYRIGDVTAYHNRMLHTVVLHRIVAITGDKYTFKGDNNRQLDQERPSRSQLIGKLALSVPHGGVWLHRLTSPPLLGVIAFALLASSGAARRRRRKGRMSRHAAQRRGTRPATPNAVAGAPRKAAVAGAAALITGALAGVAWTLPTTHAQTHTVGQTQTMSLSYSATVRPSPAYDGTTVTAPQPVFRNVTDIVELQVNYHGAAGRLRVNAQLSTPSGWTTTLTLAPARASVADAYTTRVPIHLSALDRRAQAAGRVTGLPSTPVTLTIVPTVTDRGGHVFAPRFSFTLTQLALTAPTGPNALTARSATPATATTRAASTLHLLRHSIAVTTARNLSLVAFAIAVLATAALLVAAKALRAGNEADRIRRQWSDLLLDVQPIPTPAGRPVVDVPAFTALARLAQRYEMLILHWHRSGTHTYVVQDESAVFRYRSGVAPATETGTSASASPPATQPADVRAN